MSLVFTLISSSSITSYTSKVSKSFVAVTLRILGNLWHKNMEIWVKHFRTVISWSACNKLQNTSIGEKRRKLIDRDDARSSILAVFFTGELFFKKLVKLNHIFAFLVIFLMLELGSNQSEVYKIEKSSPKRQKFDEFFLKIPYRYWLQC